MRKQRTGRAACAGNAGLGLAIAKEIVEAHGALLLPTAGRNR